MYFTFKFILLNKNSLAGKRASLSIDQIIEQINKTILFVTDLNSDVIICKKCGKKIHLKTSNKITKNMATSQKFNYTTAILFVIVITLFTLTSYLLYQPTKRPNKSLANQNTTIHVEAVINETVTLKKEIIKPLLNPRFPQCYTQIEYSMLSQILYEYHLNSNSCVGSKCTVKTKKNVTSKETASLICVYVGVALLLISLIAAVLELVKAIKNPVQTKGKPELSRRCSLADLTVLRHNRRESMVRKDSTLSIEDSSKRTSLKTIGRKMSRPRLRIT